MAKAPHALGAEAAKRLYPVAAMAQTTTNPSDLSSLDIDRTALRARTIVLVGLMGVGKTSIGRRLASELDLPFFDADAEIEEAAGLTIPEIFERFGEAHFRDGERRVIARLLKGPPHILATGGGAFVSPETRALVKETGISIWLHADVDLLVKRVSRRSNRPLLDQADPRATLASLAVERAPAYQEADLTVESSDGPHDEVVRQVLLALDGYVKRAREASPKAGPCP